MDLHQNQTPHLLDQTPLLLPPPDHPPYFSCHVPEDFLRPQQVCYQLLSLDFQENFLNLPQNLLWNLISQKFVKNASILLSKGNFDARREFLQQIVNKTSTNRVASPDEY